MMIYINFAWLLVSALIVIGFFYNCWNNRRK